MARSALMVHLEGAPVSNGDDGAPRVDAAADSTPAINVIRIQENGPLEMEGELLLAGQPPMNRATLCRCGRSQTKPLCDGSHEKGFRATGEPDSEDLPLLPRCDGPLEIKPAKDGPLILRGNFELCSQTGRRIAQGTKAALCRCGQSRRKPLCDGSHFLVDFTAD
jgi:CDGSH-type Zn-finger protein